MLKKLIKYDFRSAGRLIGVLYLAVIAMAIIVGAIVRFNMNHTSQDPFEAEIASGSDAAVLTGIGIYGLLLLILMLLTIFMIIRHFYRNMLQQEGYLMHTLPVPAWMHVASKTIVGFIWMLLAFAVAAVSLLLALASAGFLKEMIDNWSEVWSDLSRVFVTSPTWLYILTAIVGMVVTILTFYLALSIGNLANRHKFFYAILAFIAIIIIMSVINNQLLAGLIANDVSFLFEGHADPVARASVRPLVIQLIENLIYAVVFFTGTRWILQKKLNLE